MAGGTRQAGVFMGGVKAARGMGAENSPMRQALNVVGQDHNFRKQASRLK